MPKVKTNSAAKKKIQVHREWKDKEETSFQESHPHQEI